MLDPKEEIKQKLNIVDVVGSYIKLQKVGVNYRALCPFHKEKTPSFYVSPSRQIAHCFGCGFSGDIFTFVMKIENLDFPSALKVLANKAGVELPKFNKELDSAKKMIFEIQEKALKFYENNLKNHPEVIDYLKKRGLNNETLRIFRIGFAPDEWQLLLQYLLSEHYKLSEIEKTGLVIRKNEFINIQNADTLNPTSFYDRFRSRIMFPIFGISGEILGFSGRIFIGENQSQLKTIKNIEEIGKYINSPQTLVYDKSKILYMLNITKQYIIEANEAIIVEGAMDALSCHQEGAKNVVATLGTALTNHHLDLLKRYTNTLVFGFDNDEAGQVATERAVELALSSDFNLKIINLKTAKDFSEYLTLYPNTLSEALKNTKPIMEFYFERGQNLYDLNSQKGKNAFLNYFLPKINYLKNNIMERSFWIEKTATLLNTKIEVIDEALKTINHAAKNQPLPQQTEEKDEEILETSLKTRQEILAEKLLSQYLLHKDLLRDLIFEYQNYFPFQYQNIINFISNKENEKLLDSPELSSIKTILDDDDINKINYLWLLATKASDKTQSDALLKEEMESCASYLKQEYIKNRLIVLQNQIKECETNQNKEKLDQLLQEFVNLSKEISLQK